jgi:hypothetical protein
MVLPALNKRVTIAELLVTNPSYHLHKRVASLLPSTAIVETFGY